jgi:hypothetical protein
MDSWNGTDHTALTDAIAIELRAVSESARLPPEAAPGPQRAGSWQEVLISVAASWGRLTHRFPIRIARNLAVSRSSNADEPAMFTIMFGLGLVLVTYAIHLAVIGALVHSLPIVGLYLGSLVIGAYWAAFEEHPRQY